MDIKKNIIKWLVLSLFVVLWSCGARKVSRNTSLQESNSKTETDSTQKKSDSTSANIQKLSENISFELEPIGDKLAHFVYIVGKDTIKVETSGKLHLNNAKNKEQSNIVAKSESFVQKKEQNDTKTKIKEKQKQTDRVNNSFQFILIGVLITIFLQIAFKEIKKRIFI